MLARSSATLLLVGVLGLVPGCAERAATEEPAPPSSSSVRAPVPVAPSASPPSPAGAPAPSSGAASSSAAAAAPPFEGTAGVEERKRDGMAPALLREVRVAAHEGYERVVFEWAGDAVPGWHVEYVDRPVRRCGSGDPTAIAGDGWLEVRMTPAQAHDERGRATAGARERHPGQPIIREVESTCDFEGEVTWVIGVASPNRYRVLELGSPARLVVDIRTDAGRR